jgi:multiple sugar transport system ATP-binding protein
MEYLGAEWIVAGTLVGGKLEGKKVIARLASAQMLKEGETCDFAVAERELKFFDRNTEKRVEARALAWQ